MGFNFGAVGISDEPGDFKNFAFFERGLVLAIGGENGDEEVVTAESHGGDFQFNVVEWIDVFEFHEGVKLVFGGGGIETGGELLFLFGSVLGEGGRGEGEQEQKDGFHKSLGDVVKNRRSWHARFLDWNLGNTGQADQDDKESSFCAAGRGARSFIRGTLEGVHSFRSIEHGGTCQDLFVRPHWDGS